MAEIIEEEKICAMVAKAVELKEVENGFVDDDDGGVGVQQNLIAPIESESDIEWVSCKYFIS